MIEHLIDHARLLNAHDNWAYRVRILVVFGSYIRRVERPNGVDIGCELRPRWSGEKQRRLEQARRDERRVMRYLAPAADVQDQVDLVALPSITRRPVRENRPARDAAGTSRRAN